jgi:hypothetical protein
VSGENMVNTNHRKIRCIRRFKKFCKVLLSLFIIYSSYWYLAEYRFFKDLPEGGYLENPAGPYFEVKKPDFLFWNGQIEGIKEMGEFSLWRYEVVISKPPFSDIIIEERTIDKPFKKPPKIIKIGRTNLKKRIQKLNQKDKKNTPYLDFMIKELIKFYNLKL